MNSKIADAAREMHEALKPFAEIADNHEQWIDDRTADRLNLVNLHLGAFRRARVAIASYESALAAELPISISARDPRVIIAGIRQFGLASDGSDLNDLERALVAPPNVNAAANEVLSNLRGLYNADSDPKRDPIAVAIISEALAFVSSAPAQSRDEVIEK